MFITKKHLPRRTFLRGAGATIALPLLDAMLPAATAVARTAAAPRSRYSFVHFPHGAIMSQWTPKQAGRGFELSPILAPLEPFHDQLVVISNLDHQMATSQSPEEAAGDHDRTASVFLSGAHVKKTMGQDVYVGTTIDQKLAQHIGQENPLPSLEMCIEEPGALGVCGIGYSCVYANTISWASPTSPNPMERNPQIVFERLFGDGSTPQEREQRLLRQASILDSVAEELATLERGLGAADRARLDNYLQDLREIERRIALATQRAAEAAGERPETADLPFHEHIDLMFDLQVMAFKADVTRVATLMMARDLSGTVYTESGVPDAYHALSHHQDNEVRMARYTRLNTYHTAVFATLLEKLRAVEDGDGTLLDHTLVLYGSPMSNSNLHDHYPLPVLLVGGGAGRYRGGVHVVAQERTPMANLFVTMAAKEGIEVDALGDSTGALELDV